MNADPTGTRASHLDLEELIAEATGQPVGDRAREHLASCEHCRLEASRWNLVAGGIRGLAADAPEAAAPETDAAPEAAAAPHAAQPTRPRRAGRNALAGPWRKAMLATGAVAAALVLLVGIGAATGYVHLSVSHHGSQTVLTAVTGCSQLEAASGTLGQVQGDSMVLKTASGQLVTVTTTPSTTVGVSGVLLGGISDGMAVTVSGPSSGGTIAATIVSIRSPGHITAPSSFTTVHGMVADASASGFTVVTSSGTRVPATISGDTVVNIFHVRPDQVPAGATVTAIGHAGPDGTLQATAAMAIVQRSSGPQLQFHAKTRGCSPAAVAAALTPSIPIGS
jgi:hypothetical protein